MRIAYFIRLPLHKYPPCLSQILYLRDMGHDIDLFFGGCDQRVEQSLIERGIACHDLGLNFKRSIIPSSLKSFIKYRSKVRKIIAHKNICFDLYWFGTADSCFALYPTINKRNFVISVLELYDNNSFYRRAISLVINKARVVIACEDTRASIMKIWYNLKTKPYVIPNKPYKVPTEKNMVGSIDETKRMISVIRGKKVVLYQGIISSDRDLTELADAMRIINTDYYLVLMGPILNDTIGIIKRKYEKTIYIGSAPAPYHLEVTSHASIGIANYDDSCLNNLFCAPNKIYEYSAFGIPIIGSKVPGLESTIGLAGAGVCVDFKNPNAIADGLREIINNYQDYSQRAKDFYYSTDNYQTMRIIVEALE